jgi:hypothetical protein
VLGELAFDANLAQLVESAAAGPGGKGHGDFRQSLVG